MASLNTKVQPNRCSSSPEKIAEQRKHYKQCQRERQIEKLLTKSGIANEKRHSRGVFSELAEHPQWLDAYHKTIEIMGRQATAILIGDRGPGKTQCAIEVVKQMCRNLKPCMYERMRDLNNYILDMQGENQRSKAIVKYQKPYLLVLDEVQEKFDTEYSYRTLNLIIDKRYAAMKPTILIANCKDDYLIELLGPSTFERISEDGGAINFDWPSFRKQKE